MAPSLLRAALPSLAEINLERPLLIDGEWRAPLEPAGFCDVVDAATEETVASVPSAGPADVAAAVAAARRAHERGVWARTPGAERAVVLRRVAALVAERKDALAAVESVMGKPLAESKWDVDDVAACFEYYAELAVQLDARQGTPLELPDADYRATLRYEPVGVAAAIVPWNYPLLMAAWKVAPALAAGCCLVLKPSELTPLSALHLAAIASEAGVPAGVFNVICGAAAVGAALCVHPGVDKVAFTGSQAAGTKVMGAAAEGVKNVSLELGGKSAIIVFDDVDIDKAVEWVMFGCFWTNGQICSSTSRLLLHEAVAARFLPRLVEATKAIPLCEPLKPQWAEATGVLGPLVSRAQHQKVSRLVYEATADGAECLTGGKRPWSRSKGFYYEPTILRVDPSRHEIWRTEVFGPVLSVATFSTEAEAIKLANDTSFGLAAAVLSADEGRCARVANSMEAGIVWINCSQPCFVQAPWGGFKRSGIGRELGQWGLDNYLEVKQVTSYVSNNPLGWYTMPSKL
ncbi:hypothetical protein AB1Y20_009029 [Prymnesium parvum]|uniref:Aldehyde dehydrogenase domain-containing protein n=1 Tax=Prymnesium parvum TaxID=97485 RepID=A0AB34JZK6_PRYPA